MQSKLKKTTESDVIIDKSLINNKFENYQLRFDYILQGINDDAHDQPQECKQQINDSKTSKTIQLSNEHQNIRIKKHINNIAKLKLILNKHYLFIIGDIPFYYDITGIFMIDLITCCIHKIHDFSKDIGVLNLSVTGCHNQTTSNYYLIISYSKHKISLLKYDSISKNITNVFDDEIKEINTDFTIENAYYSQKHNKIFCNVLSWIKHKQNDTFHPIINIISFDTNNNKQNVRYNIHSELKGAKHYFKCFFDAQKGTFWVISNGEFRCKELEESVYNEPKTKKRKVEHNDVSSKHEVEDEYDNYDWILIECFDLETMNVVHTINFHDSVTSKIMSINCFANDNDNEACDVDRVLCVIGFEFSQDMIVFNVLDNDKTGYSLKHKVTFPGLNVIRKSRKNNREILIHKESENAFIVQSMQYITSFLNPNSANKGIQDSLQLKHNERFVGTKLLHNTLYCLTNLRFYSFCLPHIRA